MPRVRDEVRDAKVAELYETGLSATLIAPLVGLSQSAVRLALRRHGIDAQATNTARVKVAKAMLDREKESAQEGWRDVRCLHHYGCTTAELRAIIGNALPSRSRIAKAYRSQRGAAKYRGIEFHMSLPEWWKVWTDSGKWELRGRGTGYCMARTLDRGPYAVGNVYICTIGKNFSDSYVATPAAVRVAKRKKPKTRATPKDAKGYVFYCGRDGRPRAKPYVVRLKGKYIGAFATEDEAIEAYRNVVLDAQQTNVQNRLHGE